MEGVRLTVWSFFYLLLVIGIWGLEEHNPSNTAAVAALTYSPHFFWLIPLFLLMYPAFRKKNWAALDVQALTLILVLVFLMNLHIPQPQDCAGKGFDLLSYSTQRGSVSVFVLQEILNVHHPEVVALQDTGPATSSYVTALKKSGWQVTSQGGLITLSKHPILHSQGVLGALITDMRIQNKKVRIINVHLPEVRQPLTLQEDAHRHQQTLQGILSHALASNTILVGNFNAVPHGLWVKPLRKHFQEAMGLGFGYTYPTFMPVERKDQVWYNTGLCLLQHQVLPERGSDHRAVEIKLNVN
ncbi:hypothetical protein GCM10008938_00530 [Deinococcus roseus]|uniref:Endonuclease/exonuclease/phosphatase domain-containing protein n=2 Tax=Deinococcus roseus TaxID=392414 RepID=A0ABQ2CTN2_9DEIO|nr:hypothetical protein GCM10008938_00530 [Deinococcus roseus]